MMNLRRRSKPTSSADHPDFDFVRPGNENLFIGGLGEGSVGKVFLDSADYNHYTQVDNAHLFVLCVNEEVRHRIKSLETHLRHIGMTSYPRLPHCTREMVVSAYEEKYGRDDILS